MVRNSNFVRNNFYYLLILIISIGSLFTSVAASQASQEKKQSEQLKTADIITSNNIASYNDRVLPATLNLIKQYEGFRPYAYIDTSGLPVIGYGQTRINGRTVRMGQYITRAQADAALEKELYHLQRLVLSNVRVTLTPHQLGALTSLAYNAGMRVVTTSTLSRKLNAGDYQGAAREFVRWNKANKGGRLVAFPGLTKRRIAEQNLFLTPYSSVSAK